MAARFGLDAAEWRQLGPAALGTIATLVVLGVRWARRWRTRVRDRRTLERLAGALQLPRGAVDMGSNGTWGVDLSSDSGPGAIENEGGYRGLAPAPVTRVDATQRVWTRLRAPIRRMPGIVRVRPCDCREADDDIFASRCDPPTGDAQFDDAFAIRAAPAGTARQVLGREIRRLLLCLPRSENSPRLTIDEGAILLEWHGAPEPEMVQHAAAALRRAARAYE